MLRYLLLHAGHFSKYPLNHELFRKRVAQFIQNRDTIPNSNVPSLLKDCIKSNRILQANSNNNGHTHDEFHISSNISKRELELELYDFLIDNKSALLESPDVIQQYLNFKPLPSDASQIITLVNMHFQNSIIKKSIKYDLLRLAIDTLLRHNDYAHCFKLIDSTINSPQYLDYMNSTISSNIRAYSLGFAGLNALQALILPLIPISGLLVVNLGLYGLLTKWLLDLKFPSHIGRLSWRVSNTGRDNICKTQELLLINRIITHFEENNEVNLRNFHHSQVKLFSNININTWNDYQIEAPTSTEVSFIDNQYHDDGVVHLRKMLKTELNNRKIVINDLPEELYFMEFWLTQGENFEWVEPDQDPAEYITFTKFRTQNKNN